MNGLNGSVAVLTTSTTTTISNADASNKINNNESTSIDTSQIITELTNEDRYTEQDEYATGNVTVGKWIFIAFSLQYE